MKAALVYEVKKPLRVMDVATPAITPDELLIRIHASGICYSDLHALDGAIPYGKLPIVPGHEGAGVVEVVGANVRDFSIGDRVVLRFVMTCGACLPCFQGRDNLCTRVKFLGFDTDGTFSEYVAINSRHAIKLPKTITLEEGAILGCAVVTPLHAMNIANVTPGSTVAIFGLGGVGIHAVQMARIFGASDIFAIDVAETKLDLSKSLGATTIINSLKEDPVSRIKETTDGFGVDYAFEFVGLPTTQLQGIKSVRRGGTVVIVGIPRQSPDIDLGYLLANEIQLRTSFDHTRAEIDNVIRLMESGRLDLTKSISHKFSLDKVNEGIEVLTKKIGDPVRVILVS